MAQRRGRIKATDVDQLFAGLIALPIELEREGGGKEVLLGVLELAAKLDLTAYDASYIELAHRRSLPLATLDTRLRTASTALGIAVLP